MYKLNITHNDVFTHACVPSSRTTTTTTTTTDTSYKKDLEISWSLDPFASVSNSYRSFKNLPGLPHAVKNQKVDFERSRNSATCHTLLQTLQLHTISVASFPCTPRPAFCRLPSSKQQKARWQPDKEATQSTLWILSPCMHTAKTNWLF